MILIDLSGIWELKDERGEYRLKGALPGCNYLDLMEADMLEDVFYGENEKRALWVAERDWEYSREFYAPKELLDSDFVFLRISQIDTIADIYINSSFVASTKNAHIDYKFDIKGLLTEGGNEIRIYFHSPLKYVEEKRREDALTKNRMGISGYPHIRKAAYHFGWDWGPALPPSGVNGEITIEGHKHCYIEDITINQSLEGDKAKIKVYFDIAYKKANPKDLFAKVVITDSDDKAVYEKTKQLIGGGAQFTAAIQNPKLWTTEGGAPQPLYGVKCMLLRKEQALCEKSYEIGIRTVELDLSEMEGEGRNFAFILNGKKIFAKGGNWIPSDSFVTRTDEAKLEYLIKSCKEANMNMIRVWGGGFYESDKFYRLCDKYGILVWQDFAFACAPYPFYTEEFLHNVKDEIKSAVKRLKNYSCLCLLCGNNEIEAMTASWMHLKKAIKWTQKFFYDILPAELKELKIKIPYWPGSPGGGEFMKDINSDCRGDTHLWHVWHGMQPFEYYRKRYTRFCSEFGFESLPDIDTIKTFCEQKDYSLFSPPMLNHQKCFSGNEKILYYMISNYFIPAKFEELIYMSQLTQAESIKAAVEHWRSNKERCNGALYWQINDCWQALSWSSIDYGGRWKALHYYAKRFFAPVAIFLRETPKDVEMKIVNDKDMPFEGYLECGLWDFEGDALVKQKYQVNLQPCQDQTILAGCPPRVIKGRKKQAAWLAFLYDKEGREVSQNSLLFTRPNKLNLPKADIKTAVNNEGGGKFTITLTSSAFAKNVFMHIDGVSEPLNDNYFDLMKGKPKTVAVSVLGMTKENLEQKLRVYCLNNMERAYPPIKEKLIKAKIALKPANILSKIMYKFI